MTIEFDDNGKFFTDIISKTPVPVTIRTGVHLIHGNVHIAQDKRLKDELDLPEKFIAITDAVISLPDGKVLYHTNFLVVQRDEIIWVMPDNEVAESTGRNEK
jgi:hypothetical protein